MKYLRPQRRFIFNIHNKSKNEFCTVSEKRIIKKLFCSF